MRTSAGLVNQGPPLHFIAIVITPAERRAQSRELAVLILLYLLQISNAEMLRRAAGDDIGRMGGTEAGRLVDWSLLLANQVHPVAMVIFGVWLTTIAVLLGRGLEGFSSASAGTAGPGAAGAAGAAAYASASASAAAAAPAPTAAAAPALAALAQCQLWHERGRQRGFGGGIKFRLRGLEDGLLLLKRARRKAASGEAPRSIAASSYWVPMVARRARTSTAG